jgi:hypothetical protein
MLHDHAYWTDLLRQTLTRYREPLLRSVAARLVKPRGQWPAGEVIDRCVGFVGNLVQIDRRLNELSPAGRQVLALIAHSRQPRWRLGNLLEMLVALGHPPDVQPVLELLETGLLFPVLLDPVSPLRSIGEWLAQTGGADPVVFAHPQVAVRALGEKLDLPALPPAAVETPPREADGLDWPLRLSVFWQQVAAAPLRRTTTGELFKRDLERLKQDPLLAPPPADALVEAPDLPLLAAALAQGEGLVHDEAGELVAAAVPAAWDGGLPGVLESLYGDLFCLHAWNPLEGGAAPESTANPFPSAYLLLFLLLADRAPDAWCDVAEMEDWIFTHHPFWASRDRRPPRGRTWVATFLLGLAYDLRIVQAARDLENRWAVRLSPLGRWLLGLAQFPILAPPHAQTLLVQPNLEIVAYRQALTPALIARLSLFASWKSIGPACTLQLGPATAYRALERGQTFESILGTLEQHAARAVPAPVVESLRTWAGKRERLTVYAAACLLEFNSSEELQEAVARGLPAVRLSDRLALVARDDAIDFRHFRLSGTRDYSLPPEPCVTVEPDGVHLTVDATRSDLLLETELPRFAEPLPGPSANGRRSFHLTPASLAAGRDSGLTLAALEEWFEDRAAVALPPAVRLLLSGADSAPPVLRPYLVLRLESAELADGLMQWPQTRALILERLGPTALAVAQDKRPALLSVLRELGMAAGEQESGSTPPLPARSASEGGPR